MTPSERDTLIDALIDYSEEDSGRISEADFLRLEAELYVNPAARASYYDRLALHTLLELEGEHAAPTLPEETALPNSITPPTSARLAGWFAFAAVAVLATLLFVVAIIPQLRPSPLVDTEARSTAERVASGFATLSDEDGAIWDNAPPIRRGELVPQGRLELTQGSVQLELFSGVLVALEAPAAFELASAMELVMHRGALRAHVPEPARGFRVRTPNGELVDLGTEFVLDVTADRSDLKVIKGEVEWIVDDNPSLNLVEGEALRWQDGERTPAKIEATRIAALGKLASLADPEQTRASRRDAWLKHSETLRKDPRLLAYFPFSQEGRWDRTLLDASSNQQHGTIVRAERSPDRWGHPRSALDFSPTGSRVRFTVPTAHQALTLSCWVKIDSLDRWYNSLLLTDGHEVHEPHWQLMDDGRLFFSIKKRDRNPGDALMDKHIFFSPSFWTPERSGQWLHLATVYDGNGGNDEDSRTNGHVTHYLDGTQLSREAIPEAYFVDTIRIGAASIGNWSQPKRNDPHFAVRNLNGSIDEFAIFSAALNAEEIRSMYEAGKP